MPAFPTILSEMGYGVTPQPMQSPDALSRADQIMAQGMQHVAGQFAQIAGQIQQQQDVTDAAKLTTQMAMEQVEMRQRYALDPDPATVPQRFKAEIEQRNAGVLKGIQSDGVRSHVARDLSHRVPVMFAEISGDAFRRQTQAQLGAVQTAVGQQAQILAGATNEADHTLAMQGIKQSLAGAHASGLINPAQMQGIFSQAVGQAVTIQSAADPMKARALLNWYAAEMDAGTVAALTTHLHSPLQRQEAMAAARTAAATTTDSTAGAEAVYQGMRARGYDDATARGFAANAVQESGARHDPPVGDGGRSRGLFQINGPRLDAYRARYGHDPEQGSMEEALDFAHAELQGSESKALAAIQAAGNTPGDKAKAISTYFLRPKDTATEEARRAGIADRLAMGGTRGVLAERVDRVKSLTAGSDPEVQRHAESYVIEDFHREQQVLAPARADLARKIASLKTAYEAGLTTEEIPEAQIRTLLPPEDAHRALEELRIVRGAGDQFRAVQWASPQEEQATRQMLSVPGTLAATDARKTGRTVGTPAGDATPLPETPEGLKLRLQQAAKYEDLLKRKHEALATDPLAYVGASPVLQARLKDADPNDPNAQASLRAIGLALQAQVGVPERQRRVLTNAQVAAISGQLASLDPAEADMGLELDRLAQQFGDHWPQAFEELVRVGKIGGDYQLLAAMDHPSQAFARQDFQRALRFTAQKGGMEKLRHDVPPDVAKDIDRLIDGTLEPFREVARYTSGGLDALTQMRDSVRKLAMYRAIQGDTASNALETAYQGLFGLKYDTKGTMLAPKGQMDAVTLATRHVQWSLKPEDLATPPAREHMPGETEADRREALHAAVAPRQGIWVPNADSSGLVLLARLRNGEVLPALKNDGSRIEVRFNALPPVPTDSAVYLDPGL